MIKEIVEKIKRKHPNSLLSKIKETDNYYIYILTDLNRNKSNGLYLNAIEKSTMKFTTLDMILDSDEIRTARDIPNAGIFDIKVGDLNVNTK